MARHAQRLAGREGDGLGFPSQFGLHQVPCLASSPRSQAFVLPHPYRLPCPPCPPPQHKANRLEIKKDPKGLVTVPGATVVDNISSSRELMDVIEMGLSRRRVSSTEVRLAGRLVCVAALL